MLSKCSICTTAVLFLCFASFGLVSSIMAHGCRVRCMHALTTSSKLIIVSSRFIRIRIPTWLKAVHPHHSHAYQVTVVSLQVSRASSTYVFLHLECVLPCLQPKTKYLQSTYLVLSNYCNGILFKCLSVESEITVVCVVSTNKNDKFIVHYATSCIY